MILLDTHYWAWLALGDVSQFSTTCKKAIQEAADRGELLLSSISVWELGMLERKSRLRLDIPVEEWVRQAVSLPGLTIVPVSHEIALAASQLPGEFHGDPADRVIVATARAFQAKLLTKDHSITRYGKQSYVKLV